jgi:hypothetical protein
VLLYAVVDCCEAWVYVLLDWEVLTDNVGRDVVVLVVVVLLCQSQRQSHGDAALSMMYHHPVVAVVVVIMVYSCWYSILFGYYYNFYPHSGLYH